MRQIISILFFCIGIFLLDSCGTSTNAYLKSKNPNVRWMDKKAVKKKSEFPTKFAYQDDDYIYAYGYGGGQLTGIGVMGLSFVSQNKSFPIYYKIDKKTLEIVENSKDVKKEKVDAIDKVAWTNKGAWLLYTEDPKKKRKEFMAMPISLNKIETPKNLFDLEVERKSNFVQDGYGYNHDTTTITYFAEIYDGKKDQLSFMSICFDYSTMNKLWQHEYIFPHTIKKRKEIEDIDWMINKNGEAQFLLKTYFGKKKEKTKNEDGESVANYNYRFYVLTSNGKIEEYVIDTKNEFIKSIDIPFNKTKNPVVCAYTYTKNNMIELKGLVFKQIDLETKEVKNIKEITFKTKNLKGFNEETGKAVKQNSKFQQTSSLMIKDVVVADDNSIYVIGENNYYYERCYTNSRTGQTTCIPYVKSGNIMVTKVNSDGTESWSKIILKSQDVQRHMHYSFRALCIDNKLHLFFNDSEKNYKSSNLKKIDVWKGKNTSFVQVIVNQDGNYDMIEALSKKDHPSQVSLGSIQRISDNQIMFYDTKTLGFLNIEK